MKKRYDLPFQKIILSICLVFFTWIFTFSAQAQQSDRPFSVELNAGGGLIGNSTTNTAFQPEIGINYMPGKWGVGLNAGLYSYGSGFNADQYRTGYEQFTVAEQSSDEWNAISINVGPRFQQSLSRFINLNLGLDLAMNYQEGPSQSVRFNDPTGELESSGMDTDIVLAQMDGEDSAGWNTAIRPQLQLEFQPGFSNRFSFNVKTGIQHHLSDREITYTERDLSRVMQVDSPFEMHHQFENAPVVQRTESAPRTNFFANAGIKISFGGSRAPAQDYNSVRSNKPGSIAEDIGDGDADSDGDGIDDAIETAQDYNSSRSNKPSTETRDDDVVVVKTEGLEAADNFVDEIIEVLDRCEDTVCEQVRLNADVRKDKMHKVREGEMSQDEGIEQVHSIVMEDVSSLAKCESDVCRDVLTKEVQLLEHMNVLMSLVQSGRAAEAQDYNATRSNKPTSRAEDIGDGEGSGLQVVYITKDEDGKLYAWGGGPEARSQDGSGKLYSWGRAPESLASDENGQVYAWGENRRASTQNGEGQVYAWGIAARATAVDDEGKLYAWGRLSLNSNPVCCFDYDSDRELPNKSAAEAGTDDEKGRLYSWGIAPRVNTQVDDGLVYAWGVVSRASIQNENGKVYSWGQNFKVSNESCEGGMCPEPGNALYLAKELGLASAGNDIENIKRALDRCDDGVCEQVRLNADMRHEGVRRALDNPTGMDSDIEEIRSIVMEDIESLGKCETDVCREVLAMEEDLLVKMNRLSDMEQVAPAQDYNSSRSNKYSSIADGRGGNDEIIREASRMARLVNPSGQIISAGSVMMTSHPDSPIYEGDAVGGENILNRGEMNDGDSDNNNNEDPVPVKRFDLQPASYCVELGSTVPQGKSAEAQDYNAARSNKPSSRSADAGEGDLDSDDDSIDDAIETAQDYNSSRSNKPNTVADIGDVDGDGFPDMLENASFSISKRSARTGRNEMNDGDLDGDGYGDVDGLQFELEIDPLDLDDDGDGVSDAIESATYSISKRSARTGRNPRTGQNQSPIYEGDTTTGTSPLYESRDNLANNGGDSGGDDNGDVYQWTYNLSELEGASDLQADGKLTVLFTGGKWHFDVQIDPADMDDDGDGIIELIQNSSFSISKRSARM
ncbi:hypothetical protein [Rhodohalobacter sp.]|uniref:hypothetical protein n=1 Tax=Rhodohalobacter sp. TaxID=1974210 RepID=UPI002ACE3E72|nr:hypothetical protein [Rhodohalobacter sp.]MDZ7756788.1 hypothetical protein [Rhodohalobacter sp.]